MHKGDNNDDNNNNGPSRIEIKCDLSEGPPMPYHKHEQQSALHNSNYQLYSDRSMITDRTIHNSRPDIVTLDKTIKAEHLINVAIPNSHNHHRTTTEKLQKYTGLKEEYIRRWRLANGLHNTIITTHNGELLQTNYTKV